MNKRTFTHTENDLDKGAGAAVLVRFEPDVEGSARAALGCLARAALEIIVATRQADGTHGPAQVEAAEIPWGRQDEIRQGAEDEIVDAIGEGGPGVCPDFDEHACPVFCAEGCKR